MSNDNKVVWSEGMFILPQHFQQADRYVEHLVRARVAGLRGFPWGIVSLEIDRGQLAQGRFALTRCSGVLEDGTPFSFPDKAPAPPAIELPRNTRGCIVHLTLAVAGGSEREVAADGDGQTAARYVASEVEVPDTASGAERATLTVGRLRLRYALDTEPRAGMVSLGVARVEEVTNDRTVVLDESYIPPCLAASASPVLRGFLDELHGLMRQRTESLAGKVSEASVRAIPQFTEYLMLLALNRHEPALAHLAQTGTIHPEDLYRSLLQIAGELATVARRERRPPDFEPYRHDDLKATFALVMSELRYAVSHVIPGLAVSIPLTRHAKGLMFGRVTDRALLGGARFVLAVRADVALESLRGTFPGQAKIGPADRIDQLIASASRGIPLTPLPGPPFEIPIADKTVHFELERSGPIWEAMRTAPGFAIHVAGDFPNLAMELWAIREVA